MIEKMNKIQQALEKLFQQHRLIFWYDDKAEMIESFDAFELPAVKKVKIENNEFGLKYRLLKQEPEQKFLIYSVQAQPPDADNCLLDLNLAHYVFAADMASLRLQELGWAIDRKPFVEKHIDFFRSQERTEKFKQLNNGEDSDELLRWQMIAVFMGSAAELDYILYNIFEDYTKDGQRFERILRYGLADFFWQQVHHKYGFGAPQPTLKDFLIYLFDQYLAYGLSPATAIVKKEAVIFMNHWLDNMSYRSVFENLVAVVDQDLPYRDKLAVYDYHNLLDVDIHDEADQIMILALRDGFQDGQMGYAEAMDIIQHRQRLYWYKKYEHIYGALQIAFKFQQLLGTVDLSIHSLEDGFKTYIETYYQFDQLYRHYTFHANLAEHADPLKPVTERMENMYTNSFLLKLNNNWQTYVDACNKWEIKGVRLQRHFFEQVVLPYRTGEKKIYVIISDALRYESAAELHDMLLKDNRYQVELSAMLGMLPSYTQLGIAALLPNREIVFDEGSGAVIVDGIKASSQNRSKVLQQHLAEAIYVSADEFTKMTRSDGRAFVKDYRVIYIYHNGIDARGDNAKTESEVFAATVDEFKMIREIIKSVLNFNGTNILITADHGYLYQNKPLEESDFVQAEKHGDYYHSNRRFIVGKHLDEQPIAKKFTAKQLQLDDDCEVLIPRSINRLRVQGGGNRYVHGGASLQEIVIPVIQFNMKRRDDTQQVDVDVLGNPGKITSNQLTVRFYQADKVADKILPRELKIGIYAKDAKPLSNEVRLIFDSDSDESRHRERTAIFIFKGETQVYNGQIVYLQLQESIKDSNQFKVYKQVELTMLISFASEFDDF